MLEFALVAQRRIFCRACLDWSERRHRLAGALGAALLARIFELGWARRDKNSRVVLFSTTGEKALREMFGLTDSASLNAERGVPVQSSPPMHEEPYS